MISASEHYEWLCYGNKDFARSRGFCSRPRLLALSLGRLISDNRINQQAKHRTVKMRSQARHAFYDTHILRTIQPRTMLFYLRPWRNVFDTFVILTTLSGFSQIAGKQQRTVPPFFFAYLFMHPFRTLPETLSPGSSQVRSPCQVKRPYL